MAVTYNPFESEYGFKSPGFIVDDEGNVTVKSLTYLVTEEEVVADRLYFNQEGTGSSSYFTQDGVLTPGSDVLAPNPTLSFTRGDTYSFNLNNFGYLTWNIWQEDPNGNSQTTITVGSETIPVILYNEGITYKISDDDTQVLGGLSAQGKNTGVFFFEVPPLAPDRLYYGNGTGAPYGIINTADLTITGVGSFSSLNVIGDATFRGQDAEITIAPQGAYGTVTINPQGAGTINNMYASVLTLTATETVNLSPVNQNVTISPSGSGKLVLSSGVEGTMENIAIGQTSPQDASFKALNAENGLNNTVIGNVVPQAATFTQVTGKNAPVSGKHLTNKQYVDNTVAALAIALGV